MCRTFYFDRLPDEIVLSIVDRLSWKDVAKTWLLSHRFQHVSKSSIVGRKNLDFEDSRGRPCLRFVEFVNGILHVHMLEDSKVDSLRIAFDARVPTQTKCDDDLMIQLEEGFQKWLTFARAKSVRRLDINLSSSDCQDTRKFYPHFPMFDGWDKLTDLSLTMVRVNDADLEHGLKSHLVNLESLFIRYAHLERVVVASPKLKKLEMRGCMRVSSITIDFAPNLECFIFEATRYELGYGRNDPVVTVKFKVVPPKLSHVCLGGAALSQDSLSELQKVDTLEKLELQGLTPWIEPIFSPQFATFKSWDRLTDLSLKSIVVSDADLKRLIDNNLESLYIHNASHLEVVVIKSPKLKRLELRSCCSIRSIDIESAPNLEHFWYQGPRSCTRGFVHVTDAPKLLQVFMGSHSLFWREMRTIKVPHQSC